MDPTPPRAERNGKWLCSVAPGLTLYLQEPPTGGQLRAALKVYQAACPPERQKLIAGTRSPAFARWSSPNGQRCLAEHAALMDRRRDEGISIWDGELEDAWSFHLRGVPGEEGAPSASFCQIGFPGSVDLAVVIRAAAGLADVLPFLSGHCGLAASFDAEYKHAAFTQIYAWSKRHPGLEVEDLNETLPYVLDRLKSVNWLTLVGHGLWGKLPGTPTFGRGIIVTQRANGVVIQAGDRPRLGQRNAGDVPSLYVEVERALAPLKLLQHGEFAGKFAEERATLPWLYRFLRPDDW